MKSIFLSLSTILLLLSVECASGQEIVEDSFEVLTLFGVDEGSDPDISGRALLVSEKHRCVILCGQTYENELPVTENAYQRSRKGYTDAWIAIFDLDCTELLYCSYVGGGRGDECMDAAKLDEDHIVLVGTTDSNDFPVTPDASQTRLSGEQDGWYLIFNLALMEVKYATYYGGNRDDNILQVLVNTEGQIVISGTSNSANLRTTPGVWMGGRMGSQANIYLAVLENHKTVLASYLGETGDYLSSVNSLVETPDSYVLLAETWGPGYPVTDNAFQKEFGGTEDILLLEITKDLRTPEYATYIGYRGNDMTFAAEACGDYTYFDGALMHPEGFPYLQAPEQEASPFLFGLHNHQTNHLEFLTGWKTVSFGGPMRINDSCMVYLFVTKNDSLFGHTLYAEGDTLEAFRSGMIMFSPITRQFGPPKLTVGYSNYYAAVSPRGRIKDTVYCWGSIEEPPKHILPSAYQSSVLGKHDIQIARFRMTGLPTNVTETPPVSAVISMYPQPVRSGQDVKIENLSAEAISIEIYDLLGRMVVTKSPVPDADNAPSINTTHLQPGLYFVAVRSNDGVQVKKLCVVK